MKNFIDLMRGVLFVRKICETCVRYLHWLFTAERWQLFAACWCVSENVAIYIAWRLLYQRLL